MEPDESREGGGEVTVTGAFVSRLESYLMGRILKETVSASYNGSVHATKNVFVCCA